MNLFILSSALQLSLVFAASKPATISQDVIKEKTRPTLGVAAELVKAVRELNKVKKNEMKPKDLVQLWDKKKTLLNGLIKDYKYENVQGVGNYLLDLPEVHEFYRAMFFELLTKWKEAFSQQVPLKLSLLDDILNQLLTCRDTLGNDDSFKDFSLDLTSGDVKEAEREAKNELANIFEHEYYEVEEKLRILGPILLKLDDLRTLIENESPREQAKGQKTKPGTVASQIHALHLFKKVLTYTKELQQNKAVAQQPSRDLIKAVGYPGDLESFLLENAPEALNQRLGSMLYWPWRIFWERSGGLIGDWLLNFLKLCAEGETAYHSGLVKNPFASTPNVLQKKKSKHEAALAKLEDEFANFPAQSTELSDISWGKDLIKLTEVVKDTQIGLRKKIIEKLSNAIQELEAFYNLIDFKQLFEKHAKLTIGEAQFIVQTLTGMAKNLATYIGDKAIKVLLKEIKAERNWKTFKSKLQDLLAKSGPADFNNWRERKEILEKSRSSIKDLIRENEKSPKVELQLEAILAAKSIFDLAHGLRSATTCSVIAEYKNTYSSADSPVDPGVEKFIDECESQPKAKLGPNMLLRRNQVLVQLAGAFSDQLSLFDDETVKKLQGLATAHIQTGQLVADCLSSENKACLAALKETLTGAVKNVKEFAESIKDDGLKLVKNASIELSWALHNFKTQNLPPEEKSEVKSSKQ